MKNKRSFWKTKVFFWWFFLKRHWRLFFGDIGSVWREELAVREFIRRHDVISTIASNLLVMFIIQLGSMKIMIALGVSLGWSVSIAYAFSFLVSFVLLKVVIFQILDMGRELIKELCWYSIAAIVGGTLNAYAMSQITSWGFSNETSQIISATSLGWISIVINKYITFNPRARLWFSDWHKRARKTWTELFK